MENRITVSALEDLFSSVPVVWWQDDLRVDRVNLFDDCEVLSIEFDYRISYDAFDNKCVSPELCVYVGNRLSGNKEAKQ